MKKILNKRVITSAIITGVFILFCGYGVVMNIMYSNLRQEHEKITTQYEILESKINTCEQSYATLLTEKEQCSKSLADTETKLQKATTELNTLKKN